MAKFREIIEKRLRERFEATPEKEIVTVWSLNDLRLGDMVAEGVFVNHLFFNLPYAGEEEVDCYDYALHRATYAVDPDTGEWKVWAAAKVEMMLDFPVKVVRGYFGGPIAALMELHPLYGLEEVDDANG